MTAVVEVNVHTTVVREDEISDGIGALDRMVVGKERRQEPRILVADKLFCFGIGPQVVFVIWMEVYAGLLGGFPHGGDGCVLVCLMDDFRN